ncbi:predicted protein [Aspergillus terreus NIH2624]|uniref:Uncharacterized protein n=1 Tax=Aspergillus terreus (strain NIH 2624 / FGSC A1156) TaxID=341663 RepID=Q0CVA6_ASPTN|nr:uncharacterized protein ATEG_02378 [Aspergillus terreus NIH2624]EAU37340.1 predicted protein [Aspergillus terreus NIH2624]
MPVKNSTSSPVTGRRDSRPKTLLWRLHDIVDRIMVISGICSASLPIAYYLMCCYYQGIDKGTCREQDRVLMIILGGFFLVMYPLKFILQYYALRSQSAGGQ